MRAGRTRRERREIHGLDGVHDEGPRRGIEGRHLQDVDERDDHDLRGHEARAPDVAVEGADVAPRFLEVLARLLDHRLGEKLAETDDAGFLEVGDPLRAREIQYLLDLLARRADFQRPRHADQPVEPAHVHRPFQVHPRHEGGDLQLVLLLREGEQRDAGVQPVLVLLRRAGHEGAQLRQGRRPARVPLVLEEALHVGQQRGGGVALQEGGEHGGQERVLLVDPLQGDVVLVDVREDRGEPARDDVGELRDELRGALLHVRHDLLQEIPDEDLRLHVHVGHLDEDPQDARRVAQASLELGEGHQERQDGLLLSLLERLEDDGLGILDGPRAGLVQRAGLLGPRRHRVEAQVAAQRRRGQHLAREVGHLLAAGLQQPHERRLLHRGGGLRQGLEEQGMLLGVHERFHGDALHRLALAGIQVDRLVELLRLGAGRRDGVDRPQDLRAKLVLGEVVEVLDQHSRRGGRADGREGPHRLDALRFPAPLDDLVQVGDGDLVAQRPRGADGGLARARVGVVELLHEPAEDFLVVEVLEKGQDGDFPFPAQRGDGFPVSGCRCHSLSSVLRPVDSAAVSFFIKS